MPAWFYVLRLRSGQLYPGATKSLQRRYREHMAGQACRTTRLDPPTAVVYCEEYPTFAGARGREAQVKRWTRAKKEALVAGETHELKLLASSHDHAQPRAPAADGCSS
jgi:putative endonuclease